MARRLARVGQPRGTFTGAKPRSRTNSPSTGKLWCTTRTAASTSAPNRIRETVRSANRDISSATSTTPPGATRQRSASTAHSCPTASA